jgi:hypothetical protein
MSKVIQDLRFKHHSIAMWVAHGLTPEQLQRLAKVDKMRVSSLMNDPSFQELVVYYRSGGVYLEYKGGENVNATIPTT